MGFKPTPMVTNTVPPPSLPPSSTKKRLILWKCQCGARGEFLEGDSSIESEEVEHLLRTGCGCALQENGSREVEVKRSLAPIPPKLVLG